MVYEKVWFIMQPNCFSVEKISGVNRVIINWKMKIEMKTRWKEWLHLSQWWSYRLLVKAQEKIWFSDVAMANVEALATPEGDDWVKKNLDTTCAYCINMVGGHGVFFYCQYVFY